MGRSNLQTACTKFDINISVFYNRNHSVYQRNDYLVSLEPLVLWVFWVDTHSSITHDGLWTCCSNYSIVAFLILMDNILWACCYLAAVCHIVLQVIEFWFLFMINHLFSRKYCLRLWIPVHHTQATIDVAFVVKVHEHLHDRLWTYLVHCECCSVPIAWSTQLAQLLEDDATMLFLPSPGMLQKLLTSEVALLDAFLSQLGNHLCLSSNRSMVCARHPTSILTIKTCLTNKDILNRIVEHMSHMQDTCHIWWWNNYSVRLPAIWLRSKELIVHPILIPSWLHLLWRILCC